MFYDSPVRSSSAKSQRQLAPFKIMMIGVMIVLLPPFLMLAVAPMALMAVPLAFVALLCMLPVFFSRAHSNPVHRVPIRVSRLVPAIQV